MRRKKGTIVDITHIPDVDRLKLIMKAFRECDQEPTQEAVAKQFKYETGKVLKE